MVDSRYPRNCQEIIKDAASKGIEVSPNPDGTYNIYDSFDQGNQSQNIAAEQLCDAVQATIVRSDNNFKGF